MRKWRPAHQCIYIIPEIHGNIQSLEIILNRILPLRKFENQRDVVVFLGDYIDGLNGSAQVISALINIKKEYGDRAIMLKGNHEDYLMRAIHGSAYDLNNWIGMGGKSTIESYAPNNPDARPSDIVPLEHINFLKSLDSFYVLDDYFFCHGSFDHNKNLSENNVNNFVHDSTAAKYVKERLKMGENPELPDKYIYVCAHNPNSKVPFVYSRYFMLGGSAPQRLVVFELNSMEACAIKYGKSRIYSYPFKHYG